MACIMAEICGIEVSIHASNLLPTKASAPVPADTQLDCARLEELLASPITGLRRYRTSLRDGLGVCLAPFLDTCRRLEAWQAVASRRAEERSKASELSPSDVKGR